ncbi:MAG: phage holin family protein [Methylococcaceae bacterium]|nr:phage holin family protein [Methylococcaceae bacterium]
MDKDAAEPEKAEQSAVFGDTLGNTGVLEAIQLYLHELFRLGYVRFRLVALETQHAGKSLVDMIILGVMAAVLLMTAWLGVVLAAVLELMENGVITSSAILLAVALNLLLVLILLHVIHRKGRHLKFPATLGSMQAAPREPRDVRKNYDR